MMQPELPDFEKLVEVCKNFEMSEIIRALKRVFETTPERAEDLVTFIKSFNTHKYGVMGDEILIYCNSITDSDSPSLADGKIRNYGVGMYDDTEYLGNRTDVLKFDLSNIKQIKTIDGGISVQFHDKMLIYEEERTLKTLRID